jgi:predicted dehydrogenase
MEFGVLGTATIAREAFLPAVAATDHRVLAVASRDGERARAFADEHGIERSYGGYGALLSDDDLDAVYVPLPNGLHAEWTRRAADRGLDVLCEKPLGVDASEARETGRHCADRGVTLMEAFMYRYHPRTERALALAEAMEPRTVRSAFEFPLPDREDVRLSDGLAGGSLMDVGVYPITAARAVLGDPDRAFARTVDARGAGVDTAATGLLAYDDGRSATIHCGFDTNWNQRLRVDGADGWLSVPRPFRPTDDRPAIHHEREGREVDERFDRVDQYALEVEHFADCATTGRRPRTDATDAARTLAVVDALKRSAAEGGWADVERVEPVG